MLLGLVACTGTAGRADCTTDDGTGRPSDRAARKGSGRAASQGSATAARLLAAIIAIGRFTGDGTTESADRATDNRADRPRDGSADRGAAKGTGARSERFLALLVIAIMDPVALDPGVIAHACAAAEPGVTADALVGAHAGLASDPGVTRHTGVGLVIRAGGLVVGATGLVVGASGLVVGPGGRAGSLVVRAGRGVARLDRTVARGVGVGLAVLIAIAGDRVLRDLVVLKSIALVHRVLVAVHRCKLLCLPRCGPRPVRAESTWPVHARSAPHAAASQAGERGVTGS